jgi:hypothetical protein
VKDEKQDKIDELYHRVWQLLSDVESLKREIINIGEEMKTVVSPEVFKWKMNQRFHGPLLTATELKEAREAFLKGNGWLVLRCRGYRSITTHQTHYANWSQKLPLGKQTRSSQSWVKKRRNNVKDLPVNNPDIQDPIVKAIEAAKKAGPSKEFSMVVTKLQEALLWLKAAERGDMPWNLRAQ